MGFTDLVKLKLRELEKPHFDAALSGAHSPHPDKICAGYNLFDGQLIDERGNFRLGGWALNICCAIF